MRLLLALLCGFASAPAFAHPHVWVTAKAEIVYGPDGRVTTIRHHWTFDEAYSAFAVQGLDQDQDGKLTPQELQPFADTSLESLVEFGYFTVVRAGGVKQALAAPREGRMSHENGRLTLHFDLPLKAPAAGRLVGLDVYDPTFFVEFAPAEGDDAVRLVGAPAGCAVTVTRPKPPAPADAAKLSESFFQSLTAGSSFGSQFGGRAVAACP